MRGNDTSEQRFLDTTGGYVVTQRTYDIAGNTVTLKDPGGNTTTYGYNDDGSNHYAFATSVKNALNQTSTAAYDYNIGKPADSYNLNGGHTQYQYNDLLDRLTKIVRPDGGTTSYSYTTTTVDTYRDQKAVNDQALHTEILYDGLGRESETRQYESGGGYIASTRTYSALGQVATTTNPSRPGDGLGFATSYESDGLGRNTLVQTADGAQVISSYAGNAVTVKDAAGHVRKTTSDALGRINSVTEDPGGLNYAANYGYDALNDLTSVTQPGQTRSFVYDSLGRLKTAANPESGTISYTYDANGNLLTKTDARGVIACFGLLSGTSCTPGYDPLNRIKSKTYSDGTPAVTYTYDAANVANAKGHLTSVSNGTSTTNYTSFDALGNVLASNQIIAGETYTFGYTYNLADSLTKETYPSGRAVTTDYDSVDRPDATSGVLNGLSTPYASSANYWPHGGLYYFVAGNNVVPVYNYNSRLQVSNFWATVGNDPNHYLLNIVPNWGASNNDGNLQSVQEGYGASVPWASLSWLGQNYSYDGVNRINSVIDTGYSRSFQYDPYGNLWEAGNSGVPLDLDIEALAEVMANDSTTLRAGSPVGHDFEPQSSREPSHSGNWLDPIRNSSI